MRRWLFFIITLMLIFSSFQAASIATEEKTPINAAVTVKSILGITVSPSTIDFGAIDPGTTTEEKRITIECKTNDNKEWFVSLNCTAPFTSGENVILNEGNFTWNATTTGNGTIDEGTGFMDIVPFDFYAASMDEYITITPVSLYIDLKLFIPEMQAPGLYETAVLFTIYEQ